MKNEHANQLRQSGYTDGQNGKNRKWHFQGGGTDNVQLSYAGVKKRYQDGKDSVHRYNGEEINVASYTDEYLKFLRLLDKHKVDYLVIGAYAVMIHTKTPRATKDMDTWIRQTEENAVKLAASLKEFGGLEVSEEAILKMGQRIEIKSEAFKIEIWTSQEILGFEEAWERKLTDTLEDFSINVVSKEDLIKLKKHFNRPQDKMDLSLLENG